MKAKQVRAQYTQEFKLEAVRQVSTGQAILAARHALYLKARERNPARWSGATRDWTPIGAVTLNPERDSVVANHMKADDKQPLAA